MAASAGARVATSQDVTTYHDNNARTGLNDHETTLKPSNVNATDFGLIRVMKVDGKVNAEPLYVSGVSIGGQRHNVVYAATEHDSVYAFDAETGKQLWKATVLGKNEQPSGSHGCEQIQPEIGITDTPVIDRSDGAHGALFVVGMSRDAAGHDHQRLHALDLTTGAELAGSPVTITAKYPGHGDESTNGEVIFHPGLYAERVGLVLVKGTVYMGFTSHCDQGPYTGWLMGYGEHNLKQTSVLNLTPNGRRGSIWMSGTAPAADAEGNLYFLDANGSFDTQLNAKGFPANGDFGNGFLKISTSGGKLRVADYFEPYNTRHESEVDLDLGSGGALLLPPLKTASGKTVKLAVGAGKDRNIYVVNRDAMGKFNPKNNDQIYQEIEGELAGKVYSMPAYFDHTIYYGAVGDKLKAFPIHEAKLATHPSAETANAFRYPGTTPSISADGSSEGIVWAVANTNPAVLYAYEAGSLKPLYDSNQAAKGRDHFGDGNKFITPLIVDGKVFVGTPDGVAEFGLLHR